MIKKLWKKYKEYILYLVFGGGTTVVNYAVYLLVTKVFPISADITMFGRETNLGILLANVIAWIAAVAFAYITNRIWVFESKSKGFKNVFREIVEFAVGRLVTLVIEEVLLLVFVNILGFNDIIIKLIASVVTIMLNYIFSKFIIFKKDKEEKE